LTKGLEQGVKLRATVATAAQTRRGVPALLAGSGAVALAIYAAAAGPQARPASAAVPVIAASVAHRLDAIAVAFARHDGAARMDWVTAVLTTHARALAAAAPGHALPYAAGAAVYLITMKGHFTGRSAVISAGTAPPTGTYLSLVISARTFAVIYSALSREAPIVSPAVLGPVRYLQR
jgi:hypothetical protein